ncbi:MAG: hypothetical protein J6R43_01875 [Paludibacteraceae bacterium]|nr:hypothetical protein [Paludibacteraceae bacterium]
MTVIINDTNIFIDLCNVSLIDHFFQLPFEFHTVDFVINEINKNEQMDKVEPYITNKKLFVKQFDGNELLQITMRQNEHKKLSIIDCSVWIYAEKTGYRLLTGDKLLRDLASKNNVEVSGIIFIFDKLIEYGILTKGEAATKLEELKKTNKRLPMKIIDERINEWLNG